MENKLMKVYGATPSPIQTLGINLVETGGWMINHSLALRRRMNLLEGTQSWSPKEFVEYQSTRLRQMVRFAFENVPFYKRLYNLHGIDVSSVRTPSDLERLPTISKKDVINNWNDFVPRVRIRSRTRYTSGTTGSPLKVKISSDAFLISRASSMIRNYWAGYRGQLTARFVGDRPVANCNDKKLFRKSYVKNRLIFPSYCLSIQNSRRILETLRKGEVQFLQCYPSTGYILAKFLEEQEEHLPLKGVLYSSEPMHPFEREVIEERFQSRLFGFYGQAECVVSASECEKGRYHLTMVDGILEIMKGEEITQSEERGFTVCTTLSNYAMPLIRYHLDDYTAYTSDACACGRTTPTIHPIEAKMDDLILTPSGRIISPCSITSAVYKGAQHIMEAQIIQKSVDSFTMRIVPKGDFSDEDEIQLHEAFDKYLGEEVSLKFEKVSKIYDSGAYKKRRVINQISGDLFERASMEARKA